MLQLERDDPRHRPAEAVGGTTGGAGGDTDSGGSGWDLQLSRDPDQFPEGFRVRGGDPALAALVLAELPAGGSQRRRPPIWVGLLC